MLQCWPQVTCAYLSCRSISVSWAKFSAASPAIRDAANATILITQAQENLVALSIQQGYFGNPDAFKPGKIRSAFL